MEESKDGAECRKLAIVFGRAHDRMENEVIAVWQRTVERVYKQWCSTHGRIARRQNCGRKKILSERYFRRVSRLVNENSFKTRQELLQTANEVPSQSV